MIAWLALGGLALLLSLALLRGFATAPVAQVRRFGAWGLAALGGLLVLALLVAGRAGQLFWALAFFGPLLLRWVRGALAARRFAASGPAAGGESAVETATLTMRLDHRSGTMHGTVRQGQQAGRELAELTLSELLTLLDECRRGDPDSVPLLEAWLDRLAPDWRDMGGAAAEPQPSNQDGAMSRADALAVLGLSEGADAAAIRAAHRRLMRNAHPDHGGSDWLAARINEARDILLPGG
jgi:hypothetical protein